MARLTRTASFSDDDLEVVSSQAANESMSRPLHQNGVSRPTYNNREIVDISSSPAPASAARSMHPSSHGHTFGKPGQMMSSLKQKATDVFIHPKSRPEHHRDHNKTGPKPSETKPPPPPLFSSLGSPPQQQKYVQSSYYTAPHGNAVHDDQTFYTDPAKASADLKALLEGGMEEDEEEEELKGGLDDGTVEGIKVKLLPHQVEGVKWMKGRELGPVKRGKVPKGGILADDMGLGKTLQSISVIISNPKPKKEDKSWKKTLEGTERATLVVAPLALIRQWEAEIKDKVARTHRLSVCVHHGPNRTKRFQDLAKYDVVITTYQILVSEHGHSSDNPKGVQAGCFGLRWYRVILDEAHSIKNRNAKATKACCALRSEYRWCLTGTPMQNNLDELQSLVSFLRIQPYDDLQHWREQIDKPMKNGNGHLAIRRLHALLRAFMKRRTKDVLKEEGALLPGGKKALDAAAKDGTSVPVSNFKITERKVVTVSTQFSPAERTFYDKLEKRTDRSIEAMMQNKVNYANALVLLLRLRQVCDHPKLVENKIDQDMEALSTDTSNQQKAANANIDSLANAFGGMGIEAKKCEICFSDLSRDVVVRGGIHCDDCAANIEELYNESPERRKSKKKSKKVVKEKVKIQAQPRKSKKRNVIVDSDDEDEGSWIVGQEQQGALRLGKAGGTDDENAEGAGEDIGSDDSEQDSDDEVGSRLDSFVVDDEDASQQDAASDDDSFVSLDKLGSQPLKVRKHRVSTQELESDSDTDADSEDDISESDDESDDAIIYKPNKLKSGGRLMNSAKIREIIKILRKEAPEHKFIVFSQFTSMLDLVEPYLEKAGFKFTRYDGQMKNDAREESLHRLRNNKNTRVLLCSLKCGSLGLNLTAATRVIIVEPFWNPVSLFPVL